MKNVYEIEHAKAKEAITTLFTFSAAGLVLTPLIVYPYLRIPNDIRESVPDNFAIDKSETGWMNQDVFYDFVKDTFHPDLVKNNVEFPVVLFVDGHKSHLSLKLSNLCTELKIVLVCLPPNATRIMQPADVSCFKPVKTGWSDAVTIWKRKNADKMLTKVRFAKILKIVVKNSIDEAMIINGFRASGLCPFDPNAIDYTKCLGKNYNRNNVETVECKTNSNSNNTHSLSLSNAIDLKRFQEIVGDEKLLTLSQFNRDEPCSVDFALLYKIFEELSLPNNETTLMSVGTVDIRDLSTEIEDSVEQLIEPISIADVMERQNQAIDDITADGFENSNGFELISMADGIVLDPKYVSLEDFLIVPPTPVRKGATNSVRRQRQFVMTSELHKMEENIKIEEKLAKEKRMEERKQQLEERKQKLEDTKRKQEERKKEQEEKKAKLAESKAKKLQLDELKNLKKAAEREEKIMKRAAEREVKLREKEMKKTKVLTKKQTIKIVETEKIATLTCTKCEAVLLITEVNLCTTCLAHIIGA